VCNFKKTIREYQSNSLFFLKPFLVDPPLARTFIPKGNRLSQN